MTNEAKRLCRFSLFLFNFLPSWFHTNNKRTSSYTFCVVCLCLFHSHVLPLFLFWWKMVYRRAKALKLYVLVTTSTSTVLLQWPLSTLSVSLVNQFYWHLKIDCRYQNQCLTSSHLRLNELYVHKSRHIFYQITGELHRYYVNNVFCLISNQILLFWRLHFFFLYHFAFVYE